MKKYLPLFFASLALAALPVLALRFPALLGGYFIDQAAAQPWQTGLSLGLLLLALAAWRLNQTRFSVVAIGLAVLAELSWTLVNGLSGGPLRPGDAWLCVVPSGLALALAVKEGALFSQRNALRLGLLFLPAILFWAVWTTDPEQTARLLAWRIAGDPSSVQPSHGAHLSLALLGLLLWFGRDKKLAPAQVVLGATVLGQALVVWALALWPVDVMLEARIWFASLLAQAVCLGVALFLMYWQRVYLDELCGIPNRRALDEKMQQLSGTYALAMVDIDHFKKFNDTYGHEEGDNVLRLVAKHLDEHTAGRSYRYGGEEFCTVLEGPAEKNAFEIMDTTRARLADRKFSIRLPGKIRKKTSAEDRGSLEGRAVQVQVCISIGVAGPDKAHTSPKQVIQWADQGLYQAKENGRNNVVRMDR